MATRHERWWRSVAEKVFKFEWNATFKTMQDTVADVGPKANAYLGRATQYYALHSETYAKSHAPWTDRTTNARSGLRGIPDVSKANRGHFEISLSHSVPYGIWLEIKNAMDGVGRYAIIIPTIREEAPLYFEMASQIMDSLFRGPIT